MVAAQHDLGGRDRILEAARGLFSQRGFHQTSVADLAAAAQVSIGQIYRLFKGKEDIIGAIVEANTAKRVDILNELLQQLQAGRYTVEQIFEALFLDITDEGDQALSFDILAEGYRNARVGQIIALMCDRLRHLLHDLACATNSRLSGSDLSVAEELIMATMFGLGHRTLAQPELSAEHTAKGAARMLVAALRGIA